MLARLTISLTEDERTALRCMAEKECRAPREQLRHLLREKARELGVMPTGPKEERQAAPAVS